LALKVAREEEEEDNAEMRKKEQRAKYSVLLTQQIRSNTVRREIEVEQEQRVYKMITAKVSSF